MRSARVVICGGGVAALEALLALRELLAVRPHVELIAPNRRFVYEPMAVAAPFGLADARPLDLEAVTADLDAELRVGVLEGVEASARDVTLGDGTRLRYDAAIVGVGARRRRWLRGATSFGGAGDAKAFGEVLARLEQGRTSRLAFACPPGVSWTLPLYELALLTSAHVAERGVGGVELTVLTPEADPLGVFGVAASQMVRGQLADRGIGLRAEANVRRLATGRLELDTGEALEVDEVVALPRLEGPGVRGLPADADGFVPVDGHCRVAGLADVYAAGDCTAGECKQGGLAAQQADVAAACVAAGLGAPLDPPTFKPLLRGMLLTGLAPMYLRANAALAPDARGEVAASPLWWPPTKIAGRHLGPYLASADRLERREVLEDRPAGASEPAALEDSRRDARELALTLAESDARAGDFRSALAWLEVVEHLDGVLPAGYLDKRRRWRAAAAE